MKDLLKEAWRNLTAHRVRTFLSGLGILFGVAAVIGILSIGEGARKEQEALIAELGILNVVVRSAELPEEDDARLEIRRRSTGLSERDVRNLREVLPSITYSGGMREIEPAQVMPRPQDPGSIRFVGVEPGYLAGSRAQLLRGRPLTAADETQRRRVCLLGERAAATLFGGQDPIGQRLRLDRTVLTVVGIVQAGAGGETSLEGVAIQDRSGDVMMPLSTSFLVDEVTEDAARLDEVQFTVDDVTLIPPYVGVTQRMLDRRHREQPIYELVVPMQLIEQSAAQQRIFNLVMGLIAGISLLVGGIGIMNIMLASVLERTKEIAIRLAVGASPRDIQLLFIAEACLISLTGGLCGIVAGYAVATGVAWATGWTTSVSLQAVVLATVVSTLEGLLFGYLPARRAAQLQPAIAVRMG